MSDARRIASISLSSAKSCLARGNYGRAFANFLLFLKLVPERRDDVRVEFALATREWMETLERDGRTDVLFKCYDQACEMFPDHDIILNNIGAQLFRLGYVEEAAAYIRKSLLVNPDYLAARENLENISSHLVERWHFRMLNDSTRNHAFRDTIKRAIEKGYDRVLDIGTGTGILSLMCARFGAKEVYACERSLAMFEVAQDVLQANRQDHKVSLIHKNSTNIQLPDDIPERVNLVVTETFDAGLFGEHVVSTLSHAWRELLSNTPNNMGKVIPCGATLYVCGIQCEAVRLQSRLLYPALQELDLSGADLMCSTGNVAEDPYTTENLTRIKGGYQVLTDVAKLLSVNFNSLEELEMMNRGVSWQAELQVKHAGRLDALAVWFDLHLDATASFSTRPGQETCWEQAVFPVFSLTKPDSTANSVPQKCYVHINTSLTPNFHFAKDCLRLAKCEVHLPTDPPCRRPTQALHQSIETLAMDETETNNSGKSVSDSVLSGVSSDTDPPVPYGGVRELYPPAVCSTLAAGSAPSAVQPHCSASLDSVESRVGTVLPETCSISSGGQNQQANCPESVIKKFSNKVVCLSEQNDISYLNDIQLNRTYCQVLQRFRDSRAGKDVTLLQNWQRLCFVGVQALKLNYSHVTIVTQQDNQNRIRQVAALNGCQKDALTFRDPGEIERLSDKADLIMCELVEPCGALKQQVLEDLALLRATCLSDGGVIVPAEIIVHGIFIESSELENVSHVTGNDKTLGFHIAKYINVFQSQNHVDIELSTLPHTKLSESFRLLHLKLNELPSDSARLPGYLQQTHEIRVPIMESGEVTALVYWFELRLYEDIMVSTVDSRTHWKQAAIMIKDGSYVMAGQNLVTKVTLQNSCLDVKVEETRRRRCASEAIIIGV